MNSDLHTHTTFSDGSTKVEALVEMALALKLPAIAISDHDSIQSVRYAYANPVVQGMRLIPAAELTAYDAAHSRRVHLLVYFPDDCPTFEAHCTLMAQRRNTAHLQSAREIEALFPQFKTEQALAFTKDSGILYKSGIMRALQELGLSDDMYGTRYKQLFAKETGLVLHDVPYVPLEEVLETVRESHGVVVMAHPSVYKSMPLLRQMCAEGTIDGIEIDHPRNTEEDKAECRALAAQYNLIVTGGTDFHGSNARRTNPLGTCTTAPDQLARIEALATLRKTC